MSAEKRQSIEKSGAASRPEAGEAPKQELAKPPVLIFLLPLVLVIAWALVSR
ncbi:MAG TPA: hypothetical protein VHE30_25125 [Polyangiaceae bacterium]|nr:hypothetical protein [Polyangiaceae bacterium]